MDFVIINTNNEIYNAEFNKSAGKHYILIFIWNKVFMYNNLFKELKNKASPLNLILKSLRVDLVIIYEGNKEDFFEWGYVIDNLGISKYVITVFRSWIFTRIYPEIQNTMVYFI